MKTTEKDLQKYVLGFLFNKDNSRVVLIRKNKPDWQKGFTNGVGGKIEDGELPINAMRREFKEEAGIFHFTWRRFCIMYGKDWICYCYVGFDDLEYVGTTTDEEIIITSLDKISELKPLMNLYWLIPMALDRDNICGEVYYYCKGLRGENKDMSCREKLINFLNWYEKRNGDGLSYDNLCYEVDTYLSLPKEKPKE